MAYVYRYLRPKSEAVVYIGKTSGDTIDSLVSRIRAHASEDSFKRETPKSGFIIQYIEGLTAADADILETALINQDIYPPKLNKAKTSWGESGFVDLSGLEWKTYSPASFERRSPLHKCYAPRPDSLYKCSCCGRMQRIGKYNGPRYANLECRTPSGYFAYFLWLCDPCAEIVARYLCQVLDARCIDEDSP